MKTAMQQLIEIIYDRPTEISQFNAVQLLKLIEPLLEKEKEQIKNAYIIGYSDCHSSSAKDQDLYFKLLYNGKDI